jgi:hypothetical protein
MAKKRIRKPALGIDQLSDETTRGTIAYILQDAAC